jgi:hypothetical protein
MRSDCIKSNHTVRYIKIIPYGTVAGELYGAISDSKGTVPRKVCEIVIWDVSFGLFQGLPTVFITF